MITLNTAQKQSIATYARMGIDIEIIDEKTVKVTQSRLLNGYLLNQKQLHQRVREVFTDPKIHIIPIVHSLDVNTIDLKWITEQMKELGIQRNDIIKQLAIDKITLNQLFSGKTKLSPVVKAAFFYYFLTYEQNQNSR